MNKQNILSLFVFLAAAGLSSCSLFGTKDELVARVGDEKIYQSDIDFVRATQSGMDKPEKYRAILVNLISQREEVLAAKKKFGDPNGTVEKKIAALRDRQLTRIYQQFYVMENLGHLDKDLQKYYKAHPEEFKKDSCLDFISCRTIIAKKLYLSEHADSLKAFFEARLKSYETPAQVDIAYFKSSDSVAIAKVQKAMKAQKPMDSIPGIIRAKILENQNYPLLKELAVKEALFGKEPLKADSSFQTIKVQSADKSPDSSYSVVLKVLARKPATSRTLDEVRPSLEAAFIDSYKDRMVRENAGELKAKFGLKLEKIVPPDGRKYYDAHKEEFKTLPGYEVYDIESTDSAALVKAIDKPLMLVDFKALASSMSMNDSTKAKGGYVGVVRQSHALPYGIGMVPQMFDQFRDKKPGTISSVIKAPNTGRFHAFYLNKTEPPEVKPFERVAAQIQKRMEAEGNFSLDSSYVLATVKGKPLFHEKDVLALQQEIPEAQRRMYPRSRLVGFIIDWKAFSMEAEELGLDDSWAFRAFVTNTRSSLYNQMFMDSLNAGTLDVSEDQLKAGYEKYGKTVFGGAPEEKIRQPLALLLSTSEETLKYEYYRNQDRYASFPGYEAAKGAVFNGIAMQERNNWLERYRAMLHQKTPIHVYDSTYLPLVDNYSRDALVAKADSSYKARNLVAAEEAWSRLRVLYPSDDSLFARATLEIAKIENENEKYENAQREYRAYLALWPSSPDAEKALFSRAFILHENLKQDSSALVLFREFKDKYPKSELLESADWLIRNIESGGKLAQELLDKIAKQDDAAK